jgi:Protein of unknown function (DUF1236)
MNYHRQTLLAGIAALALVAGSGVASAQQSENGTAGKAPAAQQMNKAPDTNQSGKMSQGASEPNRGAMRQNSAAQEHATQQPATQAPASQNRAEQSAGKPAASTAEQTKSGKNNERLGQQGTQNDKFGRSEERNRMDRHNTAEERNRNGATGQNERNGSTAADQNRSDQRDNTAQRGRNGLEGLQGNASGMSVQLNEQQRTQIRDSVMHAHGAPRIGHVNFDVVVGTVVPRGRIHVVPVPETLVRIEPAWRGFLYFVHSDEVVIVDPHTMRIVAVVPA